MDKQGRKTGGRVKGRKNLKTREKETSLATARVAASAAVASAAKNRPANRSKKSLLPRAGMSPKDILVDAMREAHDAYRAQCIKASEVMDQADAMTVAALLLDGTAAIDEALSVAQKVREHAFYIRREAEASRALTLDTAHKVAPYEHPKLQTSTVTGDLSLHVTIAKF